MIVSRKTNYWKSLEGDPSRLSGTYFTIHYIVNDYYHRLYGRSSGYSWLINNKGFRRFKEVLI